MLHSEMQKSILDVTSSEHPRRSVQEEQAGELAGCRSGLQIWRSNSYKKHMLAWPCIVKNKAEPKEKLSNDLRDLP